eukprot:scaffold45400_cov42-Phaeocystis_antarctica.AAC.1
MGASSVRGGWGAPRRCPSGSRCTCRRPPSGSWFTGYEEMICRALRDAPRTDKLTEEAACCR